MNIMTNTQPIDILLVEDSSSDAELILEALCDSKLSSHFHWVDDGAKAIAFLRKQGKYQEAPRPALIVLDLNLPKKDGRQVLQEIKEDPKISTIPIIILTTSDSQQDIINTYRLKANCYICKPIDLESFMSMVKLIEEFWLNLVRLPSYQ
ncbi:response regulator [Moorena producens PAL-8-15-08-1]|uniref:Response regulator n=1 Tax=Moorena producens PAL-8-15-08-1 TaxID=1458985 RepID=A0A1D8TSM4_9CYAN|nr:response regulator [Moorena producens]AOX00436.1 response regulator [Moorena producens PAL-8-15-08-1]